MKEIVFAMTAVDAHDATATAMSLSGGAIRHPKNVQLVIVDNASKKPYKVKKGPVEIIRNKENRGCQYPLLQLYKKYPKSKVIALFHNDTALFEEGWDVKILEMFEKDRKLAVAGLFGWKGIDEFGADEYPIGNPLEVKGGTLPRNILKKRVKKLTPAATLDSLGMFFRTDLIPLLKIPEDILLRHGYDKIWPLRFRQMGYNVGVTGFKFQHMSMARFYDVEYHNVMKKWFDKRWNRDFPVNSVDGMMLFESRVLLIEEFKRQRDYLPVRV